LQNGGAGKLTLAAAMKLDLSQTNTHDSLQARGSGALEFALGPDLMPQFVRGKVTHEIVKGDGAFSSVAGERTELNCDLTPTEVKTFSVNFFQADKSLGALRVSGPFDINKQEGRLNLEIQSIDRQVLNLAGAARGWDFGASTLNATNAVDISQRGTVIAANGKLIGRQLGIRQGNQSTPPLDLDFNYQVTANLNDKTALIQLFNLKGQQGQNDLFRAALDKPMNLSWGQSQPGFKESSLQFTLSQLNVADWQLFLGSLPVSGKADAQLNLVAQQDGKQLKADLPAICLARPSTASRSWLRGTTRLTSPSARAAAASTSSPVSSISIAALRPTARVNATIGVEQKRPRLTPGVAKRASSAASARSQVATSWQPAAVATPCTSAMTGLGKRTIASIRSLHSANICS